MNQADIEKYAFLYFCGEKDRDILLENRSLKKNSSRWNIYMKKVQILFETIIFHKIRKI